MFDKKTIRNDYKKLRNSIDKTLITKHSDKICDKLVSLPEYINSKFLFSYVNYGSEVKTDKIINYSLANKKTVAVPLVEGKRMNFYQIDSLSCLTSGTYGILEPSPESKKITPYLNNSCLMIMPGLVFDIYGGRIGYGGGYYDRYLSETDNSNSLIKVAVCYDFQIYSDKLILENTDYKFDILITEKRIIRKSSIF